ncbi:MAG TPA: hypothetical protein VFA68_12625 [Terriglobales bacterium]|nr:hypothetical protein [Terriglobales bacterium]
MFRQYPLNGKATISTGEVPTPYHIYDGYGALIGGTADLSAVQQLLKKEAVMPVDRGDGRTFMGIWICNFTDASLGPHHELQFSFFTGDQPTGRSTDHALELLALMTRPDTKMLCHGLWNSTPQVVAYNRELLSLNSRLANSQIHNGAGGLEFTFEDGENRVPLISGRLLKCMRFSMRATWDAMLQIGFRRVWSMARQPWVSLRILNPTGVMLPRNAVTESYTKNDVNLVRYFDPSNDELVFGDTQYALLGFTPQFVQHMKGFKFVYLEPDRG